MSQNSYPFNTYSGLLEPQHYKNIGSAIWLFLWCISSTTKEIEKDGVRWGIVLGNKPLKLTELANIFGVNEKTVRRWVNDLERHGYIRITRAPYGLILTVKNSKKFNKERSDKNVQSKKGERTKMSSPDRTEVSTLRDKNVQSNKDITVDITIKDSQLDDGMPITAEISSDPFQEIESHYLQRRGRGLQINQKDISSINSLLTRDIPLQTILDGIDYAFDSYKPDYDGDCIRSFSYCATVILENHYKDQARNNLIPFKKGGARKYESSQGSSKQRYSDELDQLSL